MIRGECTKDISELIAPLRQSCEDLLCLGIMTNSDNSRSMSRITLIKGPEVKRRAEDNNSNEIMEWMNYDRKMDMQAEFDTKMSTLYSYFEELNQAVSNSAFHECSEHIQKIRVVFGSISGLFETKENVLRLKNAELLHLRNLNNLYEQESQ